MSSSHFRVRPVVVGVDGSAGSFAAVDLAAREARLRGLPLEIVHGFIWPYLDVPLGPSVFAAPDGGLRIQADRIVAEALSHARSAAPHVEAVGEVVIASPTQVLITASRRASLVVVGDRGLGAFTGLLVGSIAIHVAAHAACPVLVARGFRNPGRPVLLAADGSPAGQPAVGFAFEEAAIRGVPLTALHVWHHPGSAGVADLEPIVHDRSAVVTEEAAVLAEALAGWRDKYPDVVVDQRVVRGRIRNSIIDATRESQLVVVGARGRGGFTGMLLGSVSQAVLHHAACATAIVSHSARH